MSSRRFISREEEAAQDAVYRQLDPQALEDDESESSAPVPDAVEAAIDTVDAWLLLQGNQHVLAQWDTVVSALRERERDSERMHYLADYADDSPDLRIALDPSVCSLGFSDFREFLDDVIQLQELRAAARVPETEDGQ